MSGRKFSGWVTLPVGDAAHCLPFNDTGVHEESDCPCGAVVDDTGEIRYVWHKSFDGREDYEAGRRKHN